MFSSAHSLARSLAESVETERSLVSGLMVAILLVSGLMEAILLVSGLMVAILVPRWGGTKHTSTRSEKQAMFP